MKAEKIKDKLDIIHISRDDFNKLCEDRVAYIYDSLCLRYQIAREKAALWDAYQEHLAGHYSKDKSYQMDLARRDEMRFFEILNDLIGEHK